MLRKIVSLAAAWTAVIWSGAVLAQNVETLSCAAADPSTTFYLCADGNNCPQNENDVTLWDITGVTTGATITFDVAHTGGANNISPIDVDISGQGQTGDPSPNPVNVTSGGGPVASSYQVSAADAADGQSDFQIRIDTNPTGSTDFARVGYTISCTPGTPPTTPAIIIEKTAVNGDGTTSFDFTWGAGPPTPPANFSLTPPPNGTDSDQFGPLAVGTYVITETAVPGWTTTVSCNDPDVGSSTDNGTRTATIDLDAGETVICTFTNEREEEDDGEDDVMDDVTELFIHRRLDNLLTHGPDRARVLRRLASDCGDSPLELDLKGDITGGNGALSLSLNPICTDMQERLDIWAEGHFVTYDDSTGGIDSEGDFGILYLGADYPITPDVLLGALVQFDWTREDIVGGPDDLTGQVQGFGWMAGPYFGWKITDNLYFDIRGAWGQSQNEITLTDSVDGTRSGEFSTDRWLLSASLTGNFDYEGFRFTPLVRLDWGNEVSDEYINSLGQSVGAHDITIGRLTFGPEVGYRMITDDGLTVEPHAALIGIWNFSTPTLEIGGNPVKFEEFRARLEAGVIFGTQKGWTLRASVFYDGLGAEDFSAYGATLWLNAPLN